MPTYSEEIVFDQINAKESGHVECRQATRVLKDGVVISTTYHRHVCSPGDDMSKQDPRIQAICAASWEPEHYDAATAKYRELQDIADNARSAAEAAKLASEAAEAEAVIASASCAVATDAAKAALEAQLTAEKALAEVAP